MKPLTHHSMTLYKQLGQETGQVRLIMGTLRIPLFSNVTSREDSAERLNSPQRPYPDDNLSWVNFELSNIVS